MKPLNTKIMLKSKFQIGYIIIPVYSSKTQKQLSSLDKKIGSQLTEINQFTNNELFSANRSPSSNVLQSKVWMTVCSFSISPQSFGYFWSSERRFSMLQEVDNFLRRKQKFSVFSKVSSLG